MDQKSPLASITLWGAVITVVGMILKSMGIDVGDQLSDLQKVLPDLLQAAGILGVIYGRLRPGAGAPLTKAQAYNQIVPVVAKRMKP